MIYYVIAEEKEKKLIDRVKSKYHDNFKIIVTGVGGINVVKSLRDIGRKSHIVNIGYAGSNKLEIGTMVKVGNVKTYHPNSRFKEDEFSLLGDTTCYTSGDFVLGCKINEPVVFDMELAYILALGFKQVESYKIVSDKLNKNEYDKTLNN